jgi:hypothetical protein
MNNKRVLSSFVRIVVFTAALASGRGAALSQDVCGAAHCYFVDTNNPSASNSNPGTQSSPWKTIAHASGVVIQGDRVTVMAGDYSTERVTLSASGSAGNVIEFVASGSVRMKGWQLQGSYNFVHGFTITGMSGSSPTDRPNGAGIYVTGTNNEVSSNTITGGVNSAVGIYLSGTTANDSVHDNTISYVREAGIYVRGVNNLIASNDISHTIDQNTDADGIRFFGSGHTFRLNTIHDINLSESAPYIPHIDCFQTWGPATNILFERNTCDKSADDHRQGFTIENISNSTTVDNIRIINNVFITRLAGAYSYAPDINFGDGGFPCTNLLVANNTSVATDGPKEWSIWVFPHTSGVTIENNAYYDYGGNNDPLLRIERGGPKPKNIVMSNSGVQKSDGQPPSDGRRTGDVWMQDLQFVDRANGDYHLQSTSPLINAGTTVSQVTNDKDGVLRPQGNAYDIGAYEFH